MSPRENGGIAFRCAMHIRDFGSLLGGTVQAVTLDDVLAARARIGDRVRRTPMAASPALAARAGHPVRLKLEHRQETGSFKLRGASNAVLSLSAEARARGVVAASTGNHGRALSHAARAAGARAVVCMSALVPQNKVEAIRALGAEVRIVGGSQDDAQREVERLVAENGLVEVPPFDDPAVIAGQGTLGLEIMEEAPETAHLIVPLSGGGLIAGVALAAKATRPGARVTGVTMARGAAMHESLMAGRPVEVAEVASLADSLGGGIGAENRYTFAMARALVDGTVLVSEAEIAGAIRFAHEEHGEVIEGAAAVGIAALLSGRIAAAGPAAVVLSGGNIDSRLHGRIIAGQDGVDGA